MEMWLDNKSTLSYYSLDLQSCMITTPRLKTYPYDIPGADGQLDLLKNMGPPRYEMRTVTAQFKICGGNVRQVIDRLINELEGRTVEIVLPNDSAHYMTGDVHISCAGYRPEDGVSITANCLPWRLSRQEVVISIPASEIDVSHTWFNKGRRDVVPELDVQEEAKMTMDGIIYTLAPGTHLLSILSIPGGSSTTVTMRGGALTVRYREAIL